MSIIVLILCFFALIHFQLKTLPVTSYQVHSCWFSCSFCCNWLIWSFWLENCWRSFIILLKKQLLRGSRPAIIWSFWSSLWLSSGDITRKINVNNHILSNFWYEYWRRGSRWKMKSAEMIISLSYRFIFLIFKLGSSGYILKFYFSSFYFYTWNSIFIHSCLRGWNCCYYYCSKL